MDEQMLEQIQQMLTTATDSLRRDFRQDMANLEFRLGGRIEGIEQAQRSMESRLGERIESVALAQRSMEFRLGERIEETKRHSGVLVEDLHHKLELVIEGQQFLRQDIATVRSEMDAQTRETRALMGAAYRDLDQRVRHLEQRERP
jgi:hypothetical protein